MHRMRKGVKIPLTETEMNDRRAEIEANKTKRAARLKEEVKRKAYGLLRLSDWTQLGDADISAEKAADYVVYRSDLSTIIGDTITAPNDLVWPVEP